MRRLMKVLGFVLAVEILFLGVLVAGAHVVRGQEAPEETLILRLHAACRTPEIIRDALLANPTNTTAFREKITEQVAKQNCFLAPENPVYGYDRGIVDEVMVGHNLTFGVAILKAEIGPGVFAYTWLPTDMYFQALKEFRARNET